MSTKAKREKLTEHDEVLADIFGAMVDIDAALEEGVIDPEQAMRAKCDLFWSFKNELGEEENLGIESFIIGDAVAAGLDEVRAQTIWHEIEQQELSAREQQND
ncbi:MAG TPA: hypothetical protein VLF87_02105 [Patescibacteria group bacterium]|nr:hypothetical protein [Patescibacteria group bacterium]